MYSRAVYLLDHEVLRTEYGIDNHFKVFSSLARDRGALHGRYKIATALCDADPRSPIVPVNPRKLPTVR